MAIMAQATSHAPATARPPRVCTLVPFIIQVLLHIADYPCHGKMYYTAKWQDNYPNGDPDGITHERMMTKVRDLELQYWHKP